LIFHLY